jgi:hypothetical protein
MFINGVAQPGNQMAVTDLAGGTVAVDADSGLFLHGANVGLELAW